MVLPGRRAGIRDPVLPRASAAGPARGEADAGSGGRHARVVPAHPAPRGRPRHRERVPPAPAASAPGPLRAQLRAVPEVLPAPPLQPQLRGPPRRVLRPEPSRRGLRGDLRGLAHPGLSVDRALRGLARAAEAGIRRRHHARAGGRASARADAADRGSPVAHPQDAARALSREAAPLRPRPAQGLRRGPAPAVHRTSRRPRPAHRRRLPVAQPPGAAPPGGAGDGGVPVHDRPPAQEHHHPLPPARPPPLALGRGDAPGLRAEADLLHDGALATGRHRVPL